MFLLIVISLFENVYCPFVLTNWIQLCFESETKVASLYCDY